MYDKTTISAWGVLLNFVTVSGTTLSARLNIYLYVNNTNWNAFGKECAQCPISSGYCYHSFVILYEAIWYIQQRMHAQKTTLLIRTSDSRPTAGVSNLFGPGAKKLVPTAWRASSQTGEGGANLKKIVGGPQKMTWRAKLGPRARGCRPLAYGNVSYATK
jgi:hypothetical protein